MTHTKIYAAAGVLAVVLATAAPAAAQGRAHGRAVARGPHRVVRPQVVAPYRYYRPFYDPYRPGLSLGLGFYTGYPYYGGYPYAFGAPYYGGYPAHGYPAYGYPAYGAAGPYGVYGGVRINLPQKDAEVYADGYFVGRVDDFDGTFQQVNLEPGPHHVEVRAPGFEPIAFDVNVEPGRTITYRAGMRPSAQP